MKRFAILVVLMMLGVCNIEASPKNDSDMAGYLFVYFTGNHISQEAVCYALSQDGYNFKKLNDGKPAYFEKPGWQVVLYGCYRYGFR